MGYAFAYTQKLVTHSCGGCGIEFAIPEALSRRHDEHGAAIRCPNPACPWPSMVPTESEVQKLKKQMDRAAEGRRWAEENLEAERRSHSATKGRLTKIAKRVAAGVCPCCNRTFQNLARHMKTKHPNEAPDQAKAPRG